VPAGDLRRGVSETIALLAQANGKSLLAI
jgi:hypothetical protein